MTGRSRSFADTLEALAAENDGVLKHLWHKFCTFNGAIGLVP